VVSRKKRRSKQGSRTRRQARHAKSGGCSCPSQPCFAKKTEMALSPPLAASFGQEKEKEKGRERERERETKKYYYISASSLRGKGRGVGRRRRLSPSVLLSSRAAGGLGILTPPSPWGGLFIFPRAPWKPSSYRDDVFFSFLSQAIALPASVGA
jgi:hypothetical protein